MDDGVAGRFAPVARYAAGAEPGAANRVGRTIVWQSLQSGFEVAELPVIADGQEVDRLLLTRIAPARFRVEVLNRPAGDRDIDDWMRETGAAFAINGGFYGRRGLPDTPVISNGQALGPQNYDARHGAFAAGPVATGLHDLAAQSWSAAFSGAENALVGYPMLIGDDGRSRTSQTDNRLRANRSFVAEDNAGNIVFGTTREGFFSLDRLANFLRDAPLDLRLALNLDGGPVACQAVATTGFARSFCGQWETQVVDGEIKLLGHLIGGRRWGLPIVIVARPR